MIITENDQPMSTGDWFLTLLILALPVVNILMIIVWAMGVGNINRVNYCRAILLFVAILTGIVVLWRMLGMPVMPPLPRVV
ncbi:MAG: hypothetical protein ACU84H_06675 [Gammaproteobacteria bacterium]